MKQNPQASTHKNQQDQQRQVVQPMTTAIAEPQFVDARAETRVQQQQQQLFHNSPQAMQLQASAALANNSARSASIKAISSVSSAAPVQRKLTFSDKAESFTEIEAFIIAYGVGDFGKGVAAKFNEIKALVEGGDHTHANVGALLTSLGYVEAPDEITFKVNMVAEKLGDPGVDLSAEDTFTGVKSSKQSSHALYEVMIDGKKFMLKKEPDGKTEFGGMKEMAAQGIKTPAAVWLMIDKIGECLLMEYITTLGSGLATMNSNTAVTMVGPAKSLGVMHVTDICIGNVDRLPWRGNGNTGHLNNVFTDLLSRDVIGLDSEQNLDLSGDLLVAIKAELHEIKDDANAYATKMFNLLKKDGNKDKLVLNDEVAQVFKTHFAAGLTQALPGDIDGIGAVEDQGELDLGGI